MIYFQFFCWYFHALIVRSRCSTSKSIIQANHLTKFSSFEAFHSAFACLSAIRANNIAWWHFEKKINLEFFDEKFLSFSHSQDTRDDKTVIEHRELTRASTSDEEKEFLFTLTGGGNDDEWMAENSEQDSIRLRWAQKIKTQNMISRSFFHSLPPLREIKM